MYFEVMYVAQIGVCQPIGVGPVHSALTAHFSAEDLCWKNLNITIGMGENEKWHFWGFDVHICEWTLQVDAHAIFLIFPEYYVSIYVFSKRSDTFCMSYTRLTQPNNVLKYATFENPVYQ